MGHNISSGQGWGSGVKEISFSLFNIPYSLKILSGKSKLLFLFCSFFSGHVLGHVRS